jgi:hypothetical protein
LTGLFITATNNSYQLVR